MTREGMERIIWARLTEEQFDTVQRRANELGTPSLSAAVRAIIMEWARDHNFRDGDKEPQETAAGIINPMMEG